MDDPFAADEPPPEDALLATGDEEDQPAFEAAALQPEALVIAASEGDLTAVVNFMEGVHFSVESEDRDGSTALTAAAFGGHDHVVAYLLTRGANVNAANGTYNWTPLISAAFGGNMGVCERLLAVPSIDVAVLDSMVRGELVRVETAARRVGKGVRL